MSTEGETSRHGLFEDHAGMPAAAVQQHCASKELQIGAGPAGGHECHSCAGACSACCLLSCTGGASMSLNMQKPHMQPTLRVCISQQLCRRLQRPLSPQARCWGFPAPARNKCMHRDLKPWCRRAAGHCVTSHSSSQVFLCTSLHGCARHKECDRRH